MASFLKFEQRKLLLSAFITAQFSYAPLIWMFDSRRLKNRMNHINERVLGLVHKDYANSFHELLLIGFITVAYKNLQLKYSKLSWV